MKVWYAKTGNLKVGDWIEEMSYWVNAGFVSPDVWLDLKQEVRSDILCHHLETNSIEKKPEKATGDCKTYLTNITFSIIKLTEKYNKSVIFSWKTVFIIFIIMKV